MKIYTKTGDDGTTSLIGGSRVSKFHPRIEAYGTVDELNSFIGLVRDTCENKHTIDSLIEIQHKLFTIGSILAVEPDKNKHTYKYTQAGEINTQDIYFMETEIDNMNAILPELKNFILPGGNPIVSYCHIARTICRRAERNVISLAHDHDVDQTIIQYLNRLSDYLFVLARYLGHLKNSSEIIWQP